MSDWDFAPPPPSELGDHDVPQLGAELAGKRIAMLVCGGIAAMKTPLLARDLRRRGAEVTAFVSEEALRYVTRDALEWSTNRAIVDRLTARAEHLGDGVRFDAYLLPQATYNTINKVAAGIADGLLTTTLASALGRLERGDTAVLVAPAMHGSMHNRILVESLRRLADLGVRIVPPREAYGKHNMQDAPVLVAEVCRAVSRSPLRGRRILVTGGPTPVPIDGVRRITARFRGRLGIAIAEALHLRGADVLLVHGDGAFPVPAPLPHVVVPTYDAYRETVHAKLDGGDFAAAVFSAAVADYQPTTVATGKIPSGGEVRLELRPTAKVIDEVRARHPGLAMVTFKYEDGVSHDELLAIAGRRLERFEAVVANRPEDAKEGVDQVAWLLVRGAPPRRLAGKSGIAVAIADFLETASTSS